jgi:glutathione S-transferase
MPTKPDELWYLRIPKGQGGRAETVRLVYVLADRPWVDRFTTPGPESTAAVTGKNPYRQFPFVVTANGEHIYQSIAIAHHAAHGTAAWPSDPAVLTQALAVGIGGYDLYQHFGSFPASDEAAKKRFEDRRVPQFFKGLGEIYEARAFAIGDVPTFADCFVREAMMWCVRRNEIARQHFEASPSLRAFRERFDGIAAVRSFQERQAAAREKDDAL